MVRGDFGQAVLNTAEERDPEQRHTRKNFTKIRHSSTFRVKRDFFEEFSIKVLSLISLQLTRTK